MKKNPRILKILFAALSLMFLILSMVNISALTRSLTQQNDEISEFLGQNNIIEFKMKVESMEGSDISASLFIKEEYLEWDNRSVPTIVFVPGANSLKYSHLEKKLMLVEANFAVMAIEQRGHGESEGYFTMYELEPLDISAVIDYMESNFKQLNTTHLALIGMSLGGGTSLHCQALDERIHTSSIYHPVANISDLFEAYGADVPHLVGFSPGIRPQSKITRIPDWQKILPRMWDNKSAINIVNSSNTKNLLLLHGTEDKEVRLRNSQAIIEKVDPNNNRKDIRLMVREGLGHGGNEGNMTSFAYTFTWISHFFLNSSIDISQLELESKAIVIPTINFPSSISVESQIKSATLYLAGGLFILIYLLVDPVFQRKEVSQNDKKEGEIENSTNNNMSKKREDKNVLIMRSSAILLSYLLSALYCRLRNPSILYGPIFYSSFIALFLLFLISLKSKCSEREEDQLDRGKQDYFKLLKNYIHQRITKRTGIRVLETILVFGIPIALYFSLNNYKGTMIYEKRHMPGISIWFRYIVSISVVLLVPSLFMRDLPKKYSPLLIFNFTIGVLIFFIFVPFNTPKLLSEYINIKYGPILFATLIGVVFFIFYVIIEGISKLITKNKTGTAGMIALFGSTLLFMRVFRLI